MGVKNGVGVTLQNVEIFDFSVIQITINQTFTYNFDELPLYNLLLDPGLISENIHIYQIQKPLNF